MLGAFPQKSITALGLQTEALEPARALPVTLCVFSLTCFGVGGTTGTGILVLTGTVASKHIGCAAVLSYVLAIMRLSAANQG
jgi:hypothetical protein